MTPPPAGHLAFRGSASPLPNYLGADIAPRAQTQTGARRRPPSVAWPGLPDLGLAEFHVLARDRIVFLLHQLVGHGARILLGHVIEAGVRARHQPDLDGNGLGHGDLARVCAERSGEGWKVKK